MNTNQENSFQADGVPAWTRWDTLFLAALLVTTVAVQWWLLRPPAMSDQLNYFWTAAALPDVSPSHQRLRIGLIFPVWFFIRIFGCAEAAYYAVPFLSLMGLVAGTYLLAKYLFETGVAAISAFLILANPYILWDSSHLLPDVLGTTCFTFAVFLVALCGQNRSHWSGFRLNAMFVLAGALLGWSYLTREFTAILFPLIPVLFWVYRMRWTGLLFVALGALVLFGVELLWGALAYGDPLVRLEILSGRGSRFNPKTNTRFIQRDVVNIFWQLPILFLKRRWGFFYVLLFLLSMGGGLFYAIKGKRNVSFLLAWVFLCWAFFTFIGLCPVLFERPFLRMHKFRYWLPIIPPMMILGTTVIVCFLRYLSRFLPGLRPKVVPFLVLMAVAVLAAYRGVGSISHSGAFVKNGAAQYHEFRSFMHDLGGHWNTLWVEKAKGRSMSLIAPMYVRTFWGTRIWDGEIRYLNSGRRFLEKEQLGSGLVLIGNAANQWLSRRMRLPDYLITPPKSWSPVFISSRHGIAAYSMADRSDGPVPLWNVAARDWQVVPVGELSPQDMEISASPEERIVRLDEDRQVYVVDNRGKRMDAPSKAGRSGVPGRTVRGYLGLTVDDPSTLSTRNLNIECFFYDLDHGRKRTVRACHSALVSDEGLLAFLCAVPSGSDNDLRIGLKLTGPLTLGIGDLNLYVE